jgi:hypothetical protein
MQVDFYAWGSDQESPRNRYIGFVPWPSSPTPRKMALKIRELNKSDGDEKN